MTNIIINPITIPPIPQTTYNFGYVKSFELTNPGPSFPIHMNYTINPYNGMSLLPINIIRSVADISSLFATNPMLQASYQGIITAITEHEALLLQQGITSIVVST